MRHTVKLPRSPRVSALPLPYIISEWFYRIIFRIFGCKCDIKTSILIWVVLRLPDYPPSANPDVSGYPTLPNLALFYVIYKLYCPIPVLRSVLWWVSANLFIRMSSWATKHAPFANWTGEFRSASDTSRKLLNQIRYLQSNFCHFTNIVKKQVNKFVHHMHKNSILQYLSKFTYNVSTVSLVIIILLLKSIHSLFL